jgi:hypothetical protein
MVRRSFPGGMFTALSNAEIVISLYMKNPAREQTLHFARNFLLRIPSGEFR